MSLIHVFLSVLMSAWGPQVSNPNIPETKTPSGMQSERFPKLPENQVDTNVLKNISEFDRIGLSVQQPYQIAHNTASARFKNTA